MLTILSLCDYTGNWSRPYREAGYDVRQIDLKLGQDVRLFEALPYRVRGVLAAPMCTKFAGSGARWWAETSDQELFDALALIDACMRIILVHNPLWWVVENPVGRLKRWLGEPVYIFNPSDYGDPYTKKPVFGGDSTRHTKRRWLHSKAAKCTGCRRRQIAQQSAAQRRRGFRKHFLR